MNDGTRVPRIVLYRVADPKWCIVPNRYYSGMERQERLIGVGFVLWRWCLSIVWGRP